MAFKKPHVLPVDTAQVRAAAVTAVGTWLGDPGALGVLGGSAQLSTLATAWAEAVGDALLDSAHAVCASAFPAVRQGSRPSHTAAARESLAVPCPG